MNRRQSGQSDDEVALWARSVLGPETCPLDSERPDPAGQTWRATRQDARGQAWGQAWDDLQLPAAPAAPPGFARRVARAAEAERELAGTPILGAGWMRAAAAAALLAGMALGSTLALQGGLGGGLEALPAVDSIAGEGSGLDDDSWTATLSEEYLVALAAAESTAAAAGPAEAAE